MIVEYYLLLNTLYEGYTLLTFYPKEVAQITNQSFTTLLIVEGLASFLFSQ